MSRFLVVPIDVHALCVPRAISIANPLIRFDDLPYVTADKKEVNPQNPFLSETIQSPPLSLGGNTLAPGVHLHWSLPTALTTGRHPNGDRNRVAFDDVPDRWLVSRCRGDRRLASWIVESDYVWPAHETLTPEQKQGLTQWPWRVRVNPSTGIPEFLGEAGTPPWRYVGRQRELPAKWTQTKPVQRLKEFGERLTATGFGETTFASFYPNCRSVFGLHDPSLQILSTDWYEVIGWYSTADHDPVKRLAGDPGKLATIYAWKQDSSSPVIAERLLCYGRVNASEFTPTAPRRLDQLTVAIGTSTIEALAGLVANDLAHERRKDPGVERERDRIEDTLDAICMAERLPQREVDIGTDLEIVRHERSYRPIAGSPLYVVRNRRKPEDKGGAPTLPPPIATLVNELNSAQRAYDRARATLRADQDQLFSDWHRTMSHTAHDDDGTAIATGLRGHIEVSLDVDDLTRHLRRKADDLVTSKMWVGEICSTAVDSGEILVFVPEYGLPRTRTVVLKGSRQGSAIRWTAPNGELVPDWAAKTLAARTVALRLELNAAVEGVAEWEAASIPGPRSWIANEPVLLFSGPGAAALGHHRLRDTAKHDAAGNVLCRIVESSIDLAAEPDPAWVETLHANRLFDGLVAPIGAAQPKPFLLEWKVSLAPALTGCNYRVGTTHDYSSQYIRANWSLSETGYELRSTPLERISEKQARTVIGRSVLGDHGAVALRARLESYILNRLSQPGPSTKPDWFGKTPYAERKLDPTQAAAMKQWALDLRHQHDNEEANRSLERMRNVRGGAGLPDGGKVARAVIEAAQSGDAETLARIDAKHWEQVKGKAATAHQLTELQIPSADKPDPATAYLFSRFLQAAERKEYFGSTGGRQWFPLIHGLPDRGVIATSIAAVANSLSDEQLTGTIQLSESVVSAILDARDVTPIDSLLRLASIPGVGAGALGKLLAYVEAKSLWKPVAASEENDPYTDMLGNVGVDALADAIDAWQHLNRMGDTISQSLDGFHSGLLMRANGWQLPVADPVGFSDYRNFYENVIRPAIGANIQRAPLPLNPFLPICNGELQLSELRMVDIFGQVQKIAPQRELPARSVRLRGTNKMHLAPRLLQPARLNVRWLAGDSGQQEWNTHPASSPICGWLVTDNIDSSILFYSQAGVALGSLSREGLWTLAPGATAPLRPEDIDNSSLRAVAVELAKKKADPNRPEGAQTPIEEFVDIVESSLETIDPHAIQGEEARALLFSRPVAVTRIAASIELTTPPATRQGMYDLASEARGDAPRTDGFEKVQMPIRIGERNRLGDGVVGYWLTGADGAVDPMFHAPQAAWVKGKRDVDAQSVHWISLEESLSMIVLIDPRGTLHATSGILPPKRISIPPEQFLPAINRMQFYLATAPVLTPGAGDVQIPLRMEPGMSWQWIAREGKGILTLPMKPLIEQSVFLKAFPDSRPPGGLVIWGRLLANGVLGAVEGDATRAVVHLEALRAALDLKADDPKAIPEEAKGDVKRLLEVAGRKLANPPGTADFTPRELREGWLSLTLPPAAPSKS
jgi:hypothetical protein